jgi:hypothetical protein
MQKDLNSIFSHGHIVVTVDSDQFCVFVCLSICPICLYAHPRLSFDSSKWNFTKLGKYTKENMGISKPEGQ